MAFNVARTLDMISANSGGARWDIVSNAMRVMEQEMKKKMENDAWKTLLGEDFWLGFNRKKQLLEEIRCQWRRR